MTDYPRDKIQSDVVTSDAFATWHVTTKYKQQSLLSDHLWLDHLSWMLISGVNIIIEMDIVDAFPLIYSPHPLSCLPIHLHYPHCNLNVLLCLEQLCLVRAQIEDDKHMLPDVVLEKKMH